MYVKKMASSCFFILLILVSIAAAQLKPSLSRSHVLGPGHDMKRLDESVGSDAGIPLEGAIEINGDAKRDKEFDGEILVTESRPSKLPTKQEVQKVYTAQIGRVASQAEKAGDVSLKNAPVSVNPVFEFFSPEKWQRPALRCCPRSWNYGCRSSRVRQPCFYQYFGRVRQWCCPIWPSVFITKCNCSKCAVLTASCAREGTCRRRYSRRSFLAVCFANNQWGFLRYITKYLPSSCYCGLNRPFSIRDTLTAKSLPQQ